jgi:hypothetical protein
LLCITRIIASAAHVIAYASVIPAKLLAAAQSAGKSWLVAGKPDEQRDDMKAASGE